MRNGVILAVCICILVVMIGIGSVNATVTNIDTGEDFELIQEAIDDSDTKDGHTIVVSPGEYNENLNVYKSLAIKSVNESYRDVTIRAKIARAAVIRITGDNVSIIGFSVQGSEESSLVAGTTNVEIIRSDGIFFYKARNCYIANCSIYANDCGVCISNASNNTIEHNDIKESYSYGIWIRSNSANNSILDNAIHDNGNGGIKQYESESSMIADNNICDNVLGGIALYLSRNTVLSNNTVSDHDFMYGIKLYKSNNDTISNNTVTKNGDGMRLYNVTDSTITGNNVSYNKNGIYMFEVEDSTITENNVSYNKKDGIYVERSICEIRHNIVCWNGEWGIHAINSSESTIEENICEDNGIE